MNLPSGKQQQQFSPKKIPKQKKTETKNINIQGAVVVIAEKRNYSNYKVRTISPKRCGDPKCSHGQYYGTSEEASSNIHNFVTIQKKNTYCPCGATIQYFVDGEWFRSGNLSKYLAERK